MFSQAEKIRIAEAVEKVLLDLKHPEMPTEKPIFTLHVRGKEDWSFADISPNWQFSKENPPNVNSWNENARQIMKEEGQQDEGQNIK